MVRLVKLVPSENPEKKYDATIEREGREKTISFGQKNAKDFTTTGDNERKQRYIGRHKAREDWTKSGVDTAGFWSRWINWNRPSVAESLRDVKARFNL
jgi:hypothetical protein